MCTWEDLNFKIGLKLSKTGDLSDLFAVLCSVVLYNFLKYFYQKYETFSLRNLAKEKG